MITPSISQTAGILLGRDKHHLVLVKCTTTSATRNKAHICLSCLDSYHLVKKLQLFLVPSLIVLEATGDFFLITFNCSLPQIHSGNSLISLPPAHTWPDNHPEAPADCHRWACNCSVAWPCSEWLGENSLPNEAAQGVASPLLRPVCVGLSRQLCDLAYIGMLLSHTHTQQSSAVSEAEKKAFFKGLMGPGTITRWQIGLPLFERVGYLHEQCLLGLNTH